MVLNSNPKAYNIDKFLEFLSQDDSVFLFYFVAIGEFKITNTSLVSVFQKDLIDGTVCLKHWAGRNSRGVTQFMGDVINQLSNKSNNNIDSDKANIFLNKLMQL